jgi:hypothetical protein
MTPGARGETETLFLFGFCPFAVELANSERTERGSCST